MIMFSNTISFDAHVLQVFPPLTVGACLVIAKPEGHFDPRYIVDLILAHQVTGFMFTVPTIVRLRAPASCVLLCVHVFCIG